MRLERDREAACKGSLFKRPEELVAQGNGAGWGYMGLPGGGDGVRPGYDAGKKETLSCGPSASAKRGGEKGRAARRLARPGARLGRCGADAGDGPARSRRGREAELENKAAREAGHVGWACGGEGRKRGENRPAGLSRVSSQKGEERAEQAFKPGMRKGDFSNFQLFSYFVFKTKFKHD